MAVEYSGLWSSASYGSDRTAQVFPGAAGAEATDHETPSVWSLDRYGTVKGWRLQPRDAEHKFIRETVLVQRRIHFNKKHDVMLDAIAHKIAFVTYSQGGLKVSRDTGSPEAEPHSTSLKRSSRCVSAALTPDAKYVVGGGRDGSVSLWCCETGAMLRRFSPNPSANHNAGGLATSDAAFSGATKRDATSACGAPAAQPNAHDDWVTCVAVAAANDEQRAANPGIEYIVVTVAFDTTLKVWGVGVPPLHDDTLTVSSPGDRPSALSTPGAPIASTDVSDLSHVTLLHQCNDPRGRIDSVVLSPNCNTLFVAMTGTERRSRQKMLMSYCVAASGGLELEASECVWNDPAKPSRLVLQLGPMGGTLLLQTIRTTPFVSFELELFDAQTLRQQPRPQYVDPKKTGNTVLGAARTIHIAPSDAGFIQNYTATFDL